MNHPLLHALFGADLIHWVGKHYYRIKLNRQIKRNNYTEWWTK